MACSRLSVSEDDRKSERATSGIVASGTRERKGEGVRYCKNNNDLYLPSAVFIAQMLVGPSKQLKQIIHIEHNIVENPNWPEANQLAIYKCGRGFELGTTEKQIQVVARAGLEPGTAGLRVRHSDHSATLPPFVMQSPTA